MNKSIKSLHELNAEITNKNYNTYSFSIFGTLLFQFLPEMYIKKLSSVYISKKYSDIINAISADEVLMIRNKIETSLKKDRTSALKLDECIELLVKQLTNTNNQDIIKDIIEFEFQLLIACTELTDGAIDLLKILNKNKIRVLCISDTSYNSETISRLLDEKGILYFINQIYEVSDNKGNKDGSIFLDILKCENSAANSICYISNDCLSDSISAKKAGYHVIHFINKNEIKKKAIIKKINKNDGTDLTLIIDYINKITFDKKIFSSNFAYALAFTFNSYINSLISYCKSKDIKQIYFLSREGLFFKTIFDIVDTGDIKSYYLCASRISLFNLIFDEVNYTNLNYIFNFIEKHSYITQVKISQILYMLKIDTNEVRDLIIKYGYDADALLDIKSKKNEIIKILSDTEVNKAFLKSREESLSLFVEYLRNMNIENNERILLSDMGWSGSMQTYLDIILKNAGLNIETHGYYFGYDKTVDEKKNKTSTSGSIYKEGYIKYTGLKSEYKESKIINNITLELLTTAEHGTVISYLETQKGIIPQFTEYKEELEQYNNFSKPIQDLIADYTIRYNSLLSLIFSIYSQSEILEYNLDNSYNYFTNPDLTSAKAVYKLVMFDDFYGRKQKIKFEEILWWEGAFKKLKKRILLKRKLKQILFSFYKKFFFKDLLNPR